ncbi:MAG: DUF4391 domain-containing protein [Bacteroidetes bacterium]|nr:DUF4391 domain-containing protein [Bacteroidota bacterium]
MAMLNFPKSTEFGKKIPKEKFYSRLEMKTAMKRYFIEDIEQIVWRYKLAPSTLNVSAGINVLEIDVLEINLKRKDYAQTVFEFIDKNLPHHTVFVLSCGSEVQLLINYKEAIENRAGKFKITANYKTDWKPLDQIQLTVDGLNMDKVYESFVAQVAGTKLKVEAHETVKDAILQAQLKLMLEKEINALESKLYNEKQFNVQLKISTKLKELKNQLFELT